MKAFLKALYLYVQENRVKDYLWTSEYLRAVRSLEKSKDDLRSALTEEQGEALKAFLSQSAEVNRLEEEAAFCCALSIGMELGRL